MTDQTPDLWRDVHEQLERLGYEDGLLAELIAQALAAERAQHQQEIADETAKRVKLAENCAKERQAANTELAQRDETIRQQAEQIAELGARLDLAGDNIASLTQERDEARARCANNERGYESLIRRYEHSVTAETARAEAAEARCATLTAALEGLRVKHRECEDCWYSCPKSAEGCCNEAQGDACNCGADEQNAKIDAALDAAAPQGEGASR